MRLFQQTVNRLALAQRKSGFTLLEVLITLVLLTTGLIALLQATSSGLFSSRDNESELVALNLAQEKVEDLRNKSFANVVNEAKAAVSGFADFQRDVVVTTPVANLKQVTVTVYWNASGGEVSENIVSYVSNI